MTSSHLPNPMYTPSVLPAFPVRHTVDPGTDTTALDQVLQYIAWVASSAAPESVLLDEVVREVAETLGVPLCKVVELDSSGRWFTVVAGVGWQSGVVNSGYIPVGSTSQAGLTIALGTPLVCSDLPNAHSLRDASVLRRHAVISSISAVVGRPNLPLGVLSAHATTSRHFSSAETRFLARAAALLGRGLVDRRQGMPQADRMLSTSRMP